MKTAILVTFLACVLIMATFHAKAEASDHAGTNHAPHRVTAEDNNVDGDAEDSSPEQNTHRKFTNEVYQPPKK